MLQAISKTRLTPPPFGGTARLFKIPIPRRSTALFRRTAPETVFRNPNQMVLAFQYGMT